VEVYTPLLYSRQPVRTAINIGFFERFSRQVSRQVQYWSRQGIRWINGLVDWWTIRWIEYIEYLRYYIGWDGQK
jgi:hypothetical protein